MDDKNEKTARVNYYGVYDGHGGKFVSKFLSQNLYHFFVDKRVKYPLNTKYINNVYDKLQEVLFTSYEKQSMECGSTCVVVVHFKHAGKDRLNVMNTGDSRCVMCRDNIAMVLTRDHKPDWPDEHRRIRGLGGEITKDGSVYRINDLSVSRAFGDKESAKYITHRPDIYKYSLGKKDRFIIIACDGLWDVVSPQDAVNIVLNEAYDESMKRKTTKVNLAKKLAELSIRLDSGDNVTCIVVFFD